MSKRSTTMRGSGFQSRSVRRWHGVLLVERVNAGADDLVVELGSGTGEIGAHLARLPVRYVGLDSSPAMLDVFRSKAAEDLAIA